MFGTASAYNAFDVVAGVFEEVAVLDAAGANRFASAAAEAEIDVLDAVSSSGSRPS